MSPPEGKHHNLKNSSNTCLGESGPSQSVSCWEIFPLFERVNVGKAFVLRWRNNYGMQMVDYGFQFVYWSSLVGSMSTKCCLAQPSFSWSFESGLQGLLTFLHACNELHCYLAFPSLIIPKAQHFNTLIIAFSHCYITYFISSLTDPV